MLLLHGCARQPGPTATNEPAEEITLSEQLPPNEAAPPYQIDSGDVFQIQIIGLPETAVETQVTVDGTISYPPCDPISVRGLNVQEMAETLEKELTVWFREPQIEINPIILQNARVTILGQVARPGNVVLQGDEKLLDLLAQAGGVATNNGYSDSQVVGDLENAFFIRNGIVLPVDFHGLVHQRDMRHNVYAHPDDYIYVPARFDRQIYVLGAVNSPGVFNIKNEMTVLEALAQAGGHTRDTYLDRAILVRGSRSKPIVTRLNLQEIVQGLRPGVYVKTGDILYLPGRTSENPRFWVDKFNNSFLGSAASVYANDLYNQTK
jgi:polysaccharide export outer membrane protein